MGRVLMRAGYALAPLVVLGTVAASTGGGRHRMGVLALAVVIGAILAVTAPDRSGTREAAGSAPAAETLPEPSESAELTSF